MRYNRALMHTGVCYNCVRRSNRPHVDMTCCNHPLHVRFACRIKAMRTRWGVPVDVGRKVSRNSHVPNIIWTVWHARWVRTVIVLWYSVRHYRHLLALMIHWTAELCRISLEKIEILQSNNTGWFSVITNLGLNCPSTVLRKTGPLLFNRLLFYSKSMPLPLLLFTNFPSGSSNILDWVSSWSDSPS